jgi:hypothetical protein
LVPAPASVQPYPAPRRRIGTAERKWVGRRVDGNTGDDAEATPGDDAEATPGHRDGEATPGHRARPPITRISAVAGVAAAVVAVALGTAMIVRTPVAANDHGPLAKQITLSAAPPTVPLSVPQIVSLLSRRPDLGLLSDAHRRASCLSGLGYPASVAVLGAQPVDINGRPAVLLVLPGDQPGDLSALVVRPDCTSADTGLIADTSIRRP